MTVTQAVNRYFDRLHCTLWPGISFDLTDDKERIHATLWLIDAMREVQCLAKQTGSSDT